MRPAWLLLSPMLLSPLTGLGWAARAAAPQEPAAQDSLRLPVLLEEALAADPRVRQLRLQQAQTELRLRNLAAERLPALTGEGQVQYQSDVPEIPFRLPSGQPVVAPPHDTYDARLAVQQPIFDPTIGPRRGVEQAQLAEAQARVRTTLFALRREVNQSFFTAALLQERAAELAATIVALEARLREGQARVREGAALPGEAAALEATLLERRRDEAAIRADRRAALAVLGDLTGRRITGDEPLAVPELAGAVRQARAALDEVRARPEYEQFARTRERLRLQEDVVAAQQRPRISAFGRAGYGRPGLDFLSDRFDPYWLGGVQVRWSPWHWGAARREREALALQREIVAADEEAFTDAILRAVRRDLAALDRLEAALALDEEIIALRERVERETRLRLQEGAVTAADYVERERDVLAARLARAARRVELAETQARVLTTLGLEVR